MEHGYLPASPLAASITRAASKQTYYIVRFLVDRDAVDDAYRAYAYFRWVDDRLDSEEIEGTERREFVERQQALVSALYAGEEIPNPSPGEQLLVDLVTANSKADSGLATYVRNMMAVMEFDAQRRGKLISGRELNEYTRLLATAVTEALHYFVGRKGASPHDNTRYQAVMGAHITHMLRDTVQDVKLGYFNIPTEVTNRRGITPKDIDARAYREWVRGRVRKARLCFRAGRGYLARVQCLRCRIAGYAYMRRFELVLDSIEREGFFLREEYPERNELDRGVGLLGWALWMGFTRGQLPGGQSALAVRQ